MIDLKPEPAPAPAPGPRKQITEMLSPGNDEDFRASLPESTNAQLPEEQPRKRARRSDAGVPKGPRTGTRKPAEPIQTEIDPILERAKRKFATLGGGTTVKKIFEMLDKPLDAKESEDVDDYFYLVAKKGNLDPSQSWIIMIACGLILVLTLLGTRTGVGEMLKDVFAPKKKEKNTTLDERATAVHTEDIPTELPVATEPAQKWNSDNL